MSKRCDIARRGVSELTESASSPTNRIPFFLFVCIGVGESSAVGIRTLAFCPRDGLERSAPFGEDGESGMLSDGREVGELEVALFCFFELEPKNRKPKGQQRLPEDCVKLSGEEGPFPGECGDPDPTTGEPILDCST